MSFHIRSNVGCDFACSCDFVACTYTFISFDKLMKRPRCGEFFIPSVTTGTITKTTLLDRTNYSYLTVIAFVTSLLIRRDR